MLDLKSNHLISIIPTKYLNKMDVFKSNLIIDLNKHLLNTYFFDYYFKYCYKNKLNYLILNLNIVIYFKIL